MKQDKRALNWNSRPIKECIEIGREVESLLPHVHYKWQAYRKVAKKHHIEELTVGNYHKIFLGYMMGFENRQYISHECLKRNMKYQAELTRREVLAEFKNLIIELSKRNVITISQSFKILKKLTEMII